MLPMQLTVRSISNTPTIQHHALKYFNKISKIYGNKISNCRVVIDIAQNHKHKGKLFSVSVDITTSSKELASKKMNQNLFVAIRDAFAAVEKLLEKHIKIKSDKHIARLDILQLGSWVQNDISGLSSA